MQESRLFTASFTSKKAGFTTGFLKLSLLFAEIQCITDRPTMIT